MGINKPPSHLKAEERDIGGGKILRSLTAIARKRNHRNAPISPCHPGCE
ncbi:MAG TPA: hypothetical protein VL135_14795 [Terracidiphilus sp.]|nr:hypothetical protein [Terracidiphilus sp.]